MHLFDGGEVHLRVVLGAGEFLGHFRVGVFHVRHVDVDQTFQQLQRFDRIVTSGIIDGRERQTIVSGQFEGRGDRGGYVGRRHQIDVGTAHPLEVQHVAGQLLDARSVAGPSVADVVVLAKNAT